VTWLPWFSEYGLEQTRSFRALKIWMALLYHGRSGYAESICRDNRLADRFAELVDAHPELELVAHNLSIVCLRACPAALPGDQLDAHNHAVLRAVQLGGEAFVTSTQLDGRFVLRAAFVNPRMTTHDVERIVDEIVSQSAGQQAPR
jgi:aromatic-L-amino-acid decarboxylase